MGVQAYVMARKGVLVSNPDVANMTWTHWMFEYHALKKKEEMLFKSGFIALRKTIVSTLGLNLLRPTDEAGFPKKHEQMTEEEKDMYMPLVSWCARPEMLKDVSEQFKLELGVEQVTNPDSEYEKQVAAIDADIDGDMLPIIQVPSIDGKLKDPKIAQQERILIQPRVLVDVDGKI